MKSIYTYLFILANILLYSCTKTSDDTEIILPQVNLDLSFETDWEMANQINSIINDYRYSINLSPLSIDNKLASALAVKHTNYMINIKDLNHDNFSERSLILKANGAKSVAENLAYGYTNADDVVFAWLHSQAHKEIIEGNYNHIGYGVKKNINNVYYFTLLLYRK